MKIGDIVQTHWGDSGIIEKECDNCHYDWWVRVKDGLEEYAEDELTVL